MEMDETLPPVDLDDIHGFKEYRAGLVAKGWESYYSPLDAAIASKGSCTSCKSQTRFFGLRNPYTRHYRFFVVCERCDSAMEF